MNPRPPAASAEARRPPGWPVLRLARAGPAPQLADTAPGWCQALSRAAGHRPRDWWAIDERAALVAFVQTLPGQVLLVALFLALARAGALSLTAVLAAAACAWLPAWRSWVMLLATAAVLLRQPDWFGLDGLRAVLAQEGLGRLDAVQVVLPALVLYAVLVVGVLALARRHRRSLPVRRPVLCLLALEAALGALACAPWLHGAARVACWAVLVVYSAYLWFLAHALIDQRSRAPAPWPLQLATFHPFWGSTCTPYGKGAAFVRKHLADSPAELAVTQLKGLKLLAWATVLGLVDRALADLVLGRWQVPATAQLYADFLQGRPHAVHLGWAGLAWATAHRLVELAIFGHQIIAVARLAGLRLPRNTWRPLQALTLAEFWNRNYYYFKELLVEFFFMPTFLRVLRGHPRLRAFVATFMAAGVGNAVYHFVRDIGALATLGLQATAQGYTSYLFYCAVLASGIGLSQARSNAGRVPPATWAGCLWSGLCVWFFVVCLQVFGDESRVMTLGERLRFMASLFGLPPG
ncbi:MAG: hypothetical protein RLZZ584_4379 [Pseudomonadota bacterium]|jgi:hypothetical protein